ncbi:MAG: hypothetical protein KAS73_00525 [Candidatus Sabulitectum sp.]|nr:hypothetical protein [Candidatus Sabulitectum sp.]
MNFMEIVKDIYPMAALKRIAGAHVVDHRNLKEEELRDAILKIKPQYTHEETVLELIEDVFHRTSDLSIRVISKIILEDILLEEIGYGLPVEDLEERVIAIEQSIVDKSNETDLAELAGGKNTEFYTNLELYNFVLGVAWEHRNTKSPDEANLLRKLRNRLGITHAKHRILEAKLGKFPKPNNELHTRQEIREVRKELQRKGLIFEIRNENKISFDILPDELAEVMQSIFHKDMRTDGYRIMLGYKLFRKKDTLRKILRTAKVESKKTEKNDDLINKIIARVRPNECLCNFTTDELHDWCNDIDQLVSGTKDQRCERLIEYYNSMQIRNPEEADDERRIWFDVFESLASRDRKHLRAEGVIDKDLEIETKFEKATDFLFDQVMNHTPLNQPGTNKPDGLLSFKDMYIMWDNKSKEAPSAVDLHTHLNQFNGYMEASNKHVPIFLVIAPVFTEVSESIAVRYAAENIGRNIVLITASELKELALEWGSDANKRKDEPFPLGLLARPGRFRREALGDLF